MIHLLLCEGETDQILIGYYLQVMCGWIYRKGNANDLFPDKNINWYEKSGDTLGILSNGGDNFSKSLKYLFKSELLDAKIAKIIVIGDNDDNKKEEFIKNTICDCTNEILKNGVKLENASTWGIANINTAFGIEKINIAYMLLPADEEGALETFMLNALSENDIEKANVVAQVKEFVKNIKSNVFLKKRREKVKAELGVSIAVFSPDKVFKTMNELLEEVHWEKYDTINGQFAFLKEL